MSAVDTIENLLTLGVQISTAATKSGQAVAAFLTSPQFAAIETQVGTLLQSLKPDDLQGAVNAIQKKEADLLAGRDVTDLSVEELTQLHALSDIERQIVGKLINQPRNTFLTVLVNDVLPTLVNVVKIIIPLLT
jgi:hypothetical protein